MKRRDLPAAAIGAAVVIVLVGGVAWAGLLGDGGVIEGCYDAGGKPEVTAALPCQKAYPPPRSPPAAR